MPAATSAAVTAGTDATAAAANAIRTDAITRYVRYIFQIKGALITGTNMASSYIIPANQTVMSTKHKITSGTSATFVIKADSDTIDTIVAGTSIAEDSSPADTTITENQILTIDISAVSGSPVDLLVEVLCKEVLT